MHKGPPENPISVGCFRVVEGCARNKRGEPVMFRGGMGWVHDLRKDVVFVRTKRPLQQPTILPGIDKMAAAYEARATPADVTMWSGMLGVSVPSLRMLNVGWCVDCVDKETGRTTPVNACAFPMRDHLLRIIGIRFRSPVGKKWALKGSMNGLFIPSKLSGEGPLLIVEGPTETASALDLGFDVIGRPGNTAGRELLVAYCKKHRRDVAIVRNNDPKGSDAERLTLMGAETLAMDLVGLKVRIIWPNTKDLRDWKNSGATRAVVEARIRNASQFTNIAH